MSGNKDALVERLISSISVSRLWVEFPRRYFCLTDKGHCAIEDNYQILYIHRHMCDGVTIWNISEYIQHARFDVDCEAVLQKHLQKQSQIYFAEGDYGSSRSCLRERYEIAFGVADYENAFESITEVVYCTLSGLDNNNYIFPKHWFPYKNSWLRLAPITVSGLGKMMEVWGCTYNQLESRLIQEMKKLSYPFSVFTPEECAKICIYEINGMKDKLDGLYAEKEAEFRRRYILSEEENPPLDSAVEIICDTLKVDDELRAELCRIDNFANDIGLALLDASMDSFCELCYYIIANIGSLEKYCFNKEKLYALVRATRIADAFMPMYEEEE